MSLITVSSQFSKMPCVRRRADGPKSGEEFREDYLLKELRNNEKVTVDLDGVLSLGSSFLDEAFGGLVREGYFTHEQLKSKLTINFALQSYVDEAWDYIKTAKRK